MRVCRSGNFRPTAKSELVFQPECQAIERQSRPAAVILGRLQNLEILLEDPVTESSELVDFGAFSSPCIAESFGLIKPCIYPKFHNTITELSWLTKPRLEINLRISCMPESPRPSTTALLRTELWQILSLEFRDAFPNLEEKKPSFKMCQELGS